MCVRAYVRACNTHTHTHTHTHAHTHTHTHTNTQLQAARTESIQIPADPAETAAKLSPPIKGAMEHLSPQRHAAEEAEKWLNSRGPSPSPPPMALGGVEVTLFVCECIYVVCVHARAHTHTHTYKHVCKRYQVLKLR